ncbi:MAG: hypothetical protein GYA62_04195 [Bacteroidales bacterium]|nr:hypothetical protein [Bacteroidales bacterium]
MASYLYTHIIKETLAPLSTITRNIKLDIENNFLIQKIFAKYTDKFRIFVRDLYTNAYWSNIPINIDNFAGTPEYPAKLLKNLLLPPYTLLEYTLINDSNETNNVEICFQGLKTDTTSFPKHRYFQFAFDIPLLQQATGVSNIQPLNTRGRFAIEKLLAYKYNPDLELFVDDIQMIGSIGRGMFSGQINFDNVFGRAVRPNLVPEFSLMPSDSINITLTNPSDTVTAVQVVFDGYEVFD